MEKKRAPRFHLYLLGSICLSTANSHKLSPVKNELRDLVTQDSVIACSGMATVMKGFRDGTIATVDWPRLVEAALELERASDELLWYIHMIEWPDTHSKRESLLCLRKFHAYMLEKVTRGARLREHC